MNNEKPDIGPIAYAPETILTIPQTAEWLQVSPYTVKDWPLPRLNMPGSAVRLSAGMVLAYLEGRLDVYLRRPV
jgi:hypothetical protein